MIFLGGACVEPHQTNNKVEGRLTATDTRLYELQSYLTNKAVPGYLQLYDIQVVDTIFRSSSFLRDIQKRREVNASRNQEDTEDGARILKG
jgi:hypothetical protein